MDKLNYLRQTFAKTSGKSFENYVITQIWAGVKNLGLYPVTQQYVKRPSGYALIDLYFPQINFAIEVDETAHQKQLQADELRMEDIFSSVEDIHLIRIKEGDFDQVEGQISQVIDTIKTEVSKHGKLTWEENWQEQEYQVKLATAKEKGYLTVSDFISFTREQVTNDIYGLGLSKGYLQFGRSFFPLDSENAIWFPHLTNNLKWENSVTHDWTVITEKPLDKNLRPPKHTNTNILRHTFARYKNNLGQISYRFIGIFKLQETENQVSIYHRVSDCLNLPTPIPSSRG